VVLLIAILAFPKPAHFDAYCLRFERRKPMSHQKVDTRVLARTGARVLTQEEIANVTGGEGDHLPTSHVSRDASGRPLDITND
jgi:hypothetical protein